MTPSHAFVVVVLLLLVYVRLYIFFDYILSNARTQILGVTVYRLTIHPLAKIPGPFLAKVTGWYPAYHAVKGRRHLDQLRCHQIYG
jgi:hypothetical protein